jgi:hypothetical protein
MKVQDFGFSNNFRKEIDFMDFVKEVSNVLNLGRYQMRIVTSVPTWTGEGGEHLLYVSGSVRRLYWYDDINATWQYFEWNTSGEFLPTVVQRVILTDQTGNITTTSLYVPPAAGLYRVSVYMICTTAGGGTLGCTIGWSDNAGAKTIKPTSDVDLSSTANGATGDVFTQNTAVAITYATAIAGISGSPKYLLAITVERLYGA